MEKAKQMKVISLTIEEYKDGKLTNAKGYVKKVR